MAPALRRSKKVVQHLVIFGNPVDGFTHVGPFPSIDAAVAYIDTELHQENCWTAVLHTPAE